MENIRTFFSNIDSKKALYVILGLLAGSVVLFMLLTAGNSGDIDTFPEEGSLQDFSKRARLIDGDQLVAQLGGVRQLNAVSEDLRYFAVNAYSTYKSESTPVVGFRVDRNSKKDGDKVSFSGSFGSSKNLVKIEVTILKNDRIKTTITDTKTKLNVDSKLPSNKKINAYIAELPKNGQTYLALILRNSYPGVHSSQVAFPGGKVEEHDENLEITALRETHEEIGISPDKINTIRAFSEVYIPPSNFLVQPFLGICREEIVFQIQQSEVAGIIELPFTDLMNEAIVCTKMMDTSYAQSIEVPCFKVGNHYIWGATAMMMSELKETLKKLF